MEVKPVRETATFHISHRDERPSHKTDITANLAMVTAPADPPIQQVNRTLSSLMIAGGQIVPVLHKLTPTNDDLHQIWQLLTRAVHPLDFLVLSVLGWAMVPLFGCLYYAILNRKLNAAYETSYLYQFADHISQAARLAIVVYGFDCLILALAGMGFNFSRIGNLSQGFAKILYIAWAAQRLSVFKRYLLAQTFSRQSGKLGRATIVDRLADGIIYIITALFLLDILDVEMGIGVRSIFAFGSAGTLVVGLASRDLAAMFVSGLTLSTSDRIREGDHVRFGDGTTGKVVTIGWMQTRIQGYDNLIVVVPNSELGMQRVKNVSRITMCQVKETIRLRYEDADRVEACSAAILEEIKANCPKAITDGTKPFRAFWVGYEADHLKMMIDTHHNIKPLGQAYWANKQKVMQAIQRGVKKSGCDFVTTLWPKPAK